MSTISTARRRAEHEAPPSPLFLGLLALMGGLALFIVLLMALAFGYDLSYKGQVYSGVWMGGVDLSGLTTEQAAEYLSKAKNRNLEEIRKSHVNDFQGYFGQDV